MKFPIYLDNNATTKTDPRVVESMLPYFSDKFGNYSSKHSFGLEAKTAVEYAREQISKLINAYPDEIIFTSGATESINIAHIGFALANQNKGKHIISSMVEHSASYESLIFLMKSGFELTFIKPDNYGRVNIDDISKNIRKDTILVSLIFANNEIGTITNVNKISELCNQEKIAFHIDGTQAVGKIKVDMRKINPSMMSFTAHKIYGPKGIGALFVNKNSLKVNLSPIIFGGAQENGLRSGTLNVPAIVGFGKAAEIIIEEFDKDVLIYNSLSKLMHSKFLTFIDEIRLNGHPIERIPNNLNFTVKKVLSQDLMSRCYNISFSAGSSCASESNKRSRVLKSIGLTDEDIECSFRIGFSKFNTIEEIEFATETMIDQINYIRQKTLK